MESQIESGGGETYHKSLQAKKGLSLWLMVMCNWVNKVWSYPPPFYGSGAYTIECAIYVLRMLNIGLSYVSSRNM